MEEIAEQWLTRFVSERARGQISGDQFLEEGKKVAASSEKEHGTLVTLPLPLGKSMLAEDVLICLFSASPLLREAFSLSLFNTRVVYISL